VLRITFVAVNRFITSWGKWNFASFAAIGASGLEHLPGASKLLFFGLSASRTSLRRVLETFLSVKILLGSGPDKISAAITAL